MEKLKRVIIPDVIDHSKGGYYIKPYGVYVEECLLFGTMYQMCMLKYNTGTTHQKVVSMYNMWSGYIFNGHNYFNLGAWKN